MKQSIYPNKESWQPIQQGLTKRILITCFIMVFIGGLNSLWTNLDYNAWHDTLKRPFFAPKPDWIVAIFWGIVYSLLAISISLLMQIKAHNSNSDVQKKIKKALNLFYIQMLVNLIVPTLFFGLNNLVLVQVAVVLNLLLVVWMIIDYYKISKHASYVLIPYAIWLLYATILDAAILMMN